MFTELLSIVIGAGVGMAGLSTCLKNSGGTPAPSAGEGVAALAVFVGSIVGLVWQLASPPMFAMQLQGEPWSGLVAGADRTLVWVGQGCFW